QHRARTLELLDDMGVVRADEVLEHARATGGAQALGAVDVLERDGDTRKGCRLPARKTVICASGARERALLVDRDEGVQILEARDPRKASPGQLDRGDLAGGERRRKLG